MLSELSIAREIQLSLLPGHLPARPGKTGFDLHGQSVPARQVGGDFYDREVNRRLCPENRRTMFVTVFYGIFRVINL